jgi:high-affinity iron transporter
VGATFVVVLREGFEAALLLGIVYAYLAQIGHAESRRYVTLGGALAILASIAMGVAVSALSGPLADIGPDVIALVVIFGAVALLTWHGWWMGRHAREMRGDLQRRVDAAHASQQLWMVGLIAFTGVFREGAETVLFLWGLMTQLEDVTGWTALAGGAAGLVGAAVLGWLVFQGGRRLSVQRFFAITSVLILFVAAGLFSAGIGRLQSMGLLPGGEPLWDTSWILDDHGSIGGFLAGLVGYRARPSALEIVGYILYLAGATALVLPSLFGRKAPRNGNNVVEPATPSRV